MRTKSLRDLFESLIALEPNQREAWLIEQNLPAAQVMQLRAMLAADLSTADHFAAQSRLHLQSILVDASQDATDELLNSQIGVYRITCLIGSGGMARVYQADRTDGKFQQQVAIKVLRQSLDSDLDRRLFEREQHALASLDHPNVAKLLDGGVTASGQPYLVMDFVRGKTLLAHCDFGDGAPLSLIERVRLFASVCDGVQAAHRALIVHRDIKPSNVIVNQDGVPKLLDFGVAKLLRPDDVEQTQTHAPLTPAYAAPEQFDGRQITAATDVFSLGMVLHELLTGIRRKQGDTTRASELLRRMSNRTASVDVVRFLTGDVDNILRQAMHPEPAERYASAGDLAADLRRFLAGVPVLATPPKAWYRFKKLIRRHRMLSAVAALAIVTLLGSFALTLQQRNLARRERARAEAWALVSQAELANANSMRDFLQALFEPAQVGLSDRAAPTVRELVIQGEKELRTNRQLQPAAKVEMLTFFAFLHESVGELKTARSLADESVQLARQTLGDADVRYAAALAMRGFTAVRMEDYAAAKLDLEIALPKMQAQGAQGWMLSNAMQAMSTVENMHGHAERSLAYAKADLAERIRTYGADDRRVGVGYNNVADALEAMGRYLESIPDYEQAYRIQLQRLGPDSAETTTTLAGLASSLWRAGRWQLAAKHFAQAEAAFERIGGKAQIVQVYQIQKQCQLAHVLAHESEVARVCPKAARLTEQVLGADSSSMGDFYASEMEGAIERGDAVAAQAFYAKADRLFPNNIPNRLRRGRLQSNYAGLLLHLNQPTLARALLLEAIPNISARPHKMPLLLAQARLLQACKLAPEAVCFKDLRGEFDSTRRLVEPFAHPQILQADSMLAAINEGNAVDDIQRLAQSLAFAKAQLPASHVRITEGTLWLAYAYARSGDCAKAKALGQLVSGHSREHLVVKAVFDRLRVRCE